MGVLWGRSWGGWPDGPRAQRLLLARHGRTEWNATRRFQGQADVPLDDVGREQAHALAAGLAGEQIDALVSSDLLRARETAEIVAADRGLDIVFDERLREIDVGTWSGRMLADIRGEDPGLGGRIERGEDPPRGGAETLAELRARVAAALADALPRAPDGTLLIVAHGGVVRTIAVYLLDIPDALAGRLHSGRNTSVSEFALADTGPQLVRWNDAGHLA